MNAQREIESLRVADIHVGPRHRTPEQTSIDALAKSMTEIGLRCPVLVRIADEIEIDGEKIFDMPMLVAGATRLAAAKQLMWERIDVIEIDGDEIDAEMVEIAENLHRIDLTKEERDAHIRRYAELLVKREEERKKREAEELQSRQNAPIESKRADGRGHRPQGIASQIASQTGLSKSTVNRALNPKPPAYKPPVEVKTDDEIAHEQYEALCRLWNKSSPKARELFIDFIN